MRGYTPVIRVEVNGRDVSSGFYSRLIKATIRDEEGQTSDTLTVELDDDGNDIEIPEAGAKLSVALGFKETGLVSMGEFEFQSYSCAGSEKGETVTLQCKSASLRKGEKAGGREHFAGKTLGDIVEEVAKRHGLRGVVEAELANIKIPYVARIDQSTLDFVTRLVERNGGIVKRSGSKLAVTKRGSGKSASGETVPPIVITKTLDHVKSWTIGSDPRPRYGKVRAPYLDQKTGKREVEEAETGFDDGPEYPIRHPLASKDDARQAAEAKAAELSRNTGTGSFELYGRPDASAGAVVIASGFRKEVSGERRAHAVEHVFESGSGGGFTTKVEVKAPEKGKRDE